MEKSCYYAALTKARAMYGKRLNAEQYAGLLRCASVTEIAEYLRSQTEYGVYLEALPQTGVHRGQLENLLRRSLTDRMMKLERFDRKDGVCVYHMMRQEIAAIVSAANAVLTGDMTRMIAGLPLYMERRASFSIESLGEVQTREDLEVVLLNTRYAQAWKKACGSGGINPGQAGIADAQRLL